MLDLRFFVPDQPVPKARGRSVGKRRPMTPVRTEQYENRFALEARAAGAGVVDEAFPGFVGLELEAVWRRPKAMPPGPRLPRAGADVDNVLKSVLDGVVKSGLIVDDDRVAHVIAWKFYGATGEEPGVHVHLFSLEAL